MLYIGEKVGPDDPSLPEVDIAVDPLEGTNLVAHGKPGALAVLAVANRGDLLNAPDVYMDKLAAGHGSRHDVEVLYELDQLMHQATHCGLGGAACNPLRDTIAKFRPAYERRLRSLHFEPAFDLDAALAPARRAAGRIEPAAPQETP